ncbi:MAG: spore germination protein [Eubacteriales bacterium]
MQLSTSLSHNISYAHKHFPIHRSFDVITRELYLGETKAYWMGINGFCRVELLQTLFTNLQNPTFTKDTTIEDIQTYMNSKIGFSQSELCNNWGEIEKHFLSGPCVLFVDGFDQAIILDTRSYPTRGIQEPDIEQVTMGAKDGFVETMLFNANLIRRRIRNPQLIFELAEVGSDSKTDISIAYMEEYVDPALLNAIRQRINNLCVTSLTMGSRSLEELLIPKRWFHPLPSLHQTQRPDVACSFLLEGHILLLVDTTPSALILPCTIFQFTQSPEDYYKNPLVGTYIRLLRFLSIIIGLFLLPVFLLIGGYLPEVAQSLHLLGSNPIGPLELFAFIVIAEFGLGLFQYTSSHIANRFNTSLSIVGGLIIGEIAVSLNWLSLEVIFYSAITLLTSFALASIDFSEGLRMYRILLILSTGLGGIPGFLVGLFLVIWSIATTPTFHGKSYFWPLYPLEWNALRTLLFRYPTTKAQPSTIWKRNERSS